MKKILSLIVALLIAVSLVSLAGCVEFHGITGSKNLETRQFDYTGFTKIEISDAFKVDVTRGDSYGISVTLNDNIFNELQVTLNGDTLSIGLNPSARIINVTQRAEISLPELASLKIIGACQANVSGFQSEGSLALEADGASGMDISNIKAADATVKVIGFSHLSGDLVANNCDFEVTGASNLKLTGSGSTLKVNVVGASHADLKDYVVQDASVTAVGASEVEIEAHGTLDIDISGVSTLVYGDSPKLGKVNVSGASTLSRR